MLCKNNLHDLISEQTFTVSSKSRNQLTPTSGEIQQLIGMKMLMSIIDLPHVLGIGNEISTYRRHNVGQPKQAIALKFAY